MRRRLLGVSTSLLGLLMLTLLVPLVTTYADERTQDLFVSRLGDVTRFAVLSQEALESGDADALATDLERYVEVFDGSVVVTNANQQVVASAGASADVRRDDVAEVMQEALTGSGSAPPSIAWPWEDDSMVIGSPVGRDAQVLGAVVMVAPTGSVQDAVLAAFALALLAGVATVLVTGLGLVVPFVGWILRPVHDLDEAARRLADGDLSSRAHRTGPPELRALAGSFNAMADNVETSQRQQRDLVADAAHQLGNPLTALRLRVENLAVQGAPAEAVEPALEETDRLNAIVESLLDLSQVGAQQVVLEPVDVSSLVRHRCTMWQPMFEELTVSAPSSTVALGAPDLIDVALDALLDNAAKFAPGSPVEVAVVPLGGEVLVRVRDHGPGLDAEDVAKVGARFFRGRAHQNVAGTGLGLAIVRARLEEVGGSLVVHRAGGGGLQVEARLPSLRDAARGSSALPRGAAPGEM